MVFPTEWPPTPTGSDIKRSQIYNSSKILPHPSRKGLTTEGLRKVRLFNHVLPPNVLETFFSALQTFWQERALYCGTHGTHVSILKIWTLYLQFLNSFKQNQYTRKWSTHQVVWSDTRLAYKLHIFFHIFFQSTSGCGSMNIWMYGAWKTFWLQKFFYGMLCDTLLRRMLSRASP